MTAHKHLKERIRARMARTGESYTTARRHVLNALPPAEYRLTGGVHPDTHAIAGVLANRGLVDPHTGRPLSEAMVLGVGGGLGAGYILWEFKAHDLRSLVLGFRNSWQYPDRWAKKTCQRLGVPAAVHECGVGAILWSTGLSYDADKLTTQKVIEESEPERLIKAYRDTLDGGQQSVSPVLSNFKSKFAVDWAPFLNSKWTDAADTQETSCSAERPPNSTTRRTRSGGAGWSGDPDEVERD